MVRHIAGPFRSESDAPDIFCPTVGCLLMANHSGCCEECDVCAQFGSHDAPLVGPLRPIYSDLPNAVYYVGKHIGSEEARVARFSGYAPKHGAGIRSNF